MDARQAYTEYRRIRDEAWITYQQIKAQGDSTLTDQAHTGYRRVRDQAYTAYKQYLGDVSERR